MRCRACDGGTLDKGWFRSGRICPLSEGHGTVEALQTDCKRCKGQGHIAGGILVGHIKCPACEGLKVVNGHQYLCSAGCEGTGNLSAWLGLSSRGCPGCNGAGFVPRRQQVEQSWTWSRAGCTLLTALPLAPPSGLPPLPRAWKRADELACALAEQVGRGALLESVYTWPLSFSCSYTE